MSTRGAVSLHTQEYKVWCANDSLAETLEKLALSQTKVNIQSRTMLTDAPPCVGEEAYRTSLVILPKSSVMRTFFMKLIGLPQKHQGHYKQGGSEKLREIGGLVC